MTVTSSISQRKAISGGVRPGGRGRAIVNMDSLSLVCYCGMCCSWWSRRIFGEGDKITDATERKSSRVLSLKESTRADGQETKPRS